VKVLPPDAASRVSVERFERFERELALPSSWSVLPSGSGA
jgi:hypothetical protein